MLPNLNVKGGYFVILSSIKKRKKREEAQAFCASRTH